jgi:hypothetical protein
MSDGVTFKRTFCQKCVCVCVFCCCSFFFFGCFVQLWKEARAIEQQRICNLFVVFIFFGNCDERSGNMIMMVNIPIILHFHAMVRSKKMMESGF